MKENVYVSETWDWTRHIQIFSLTLSQLSYFGWLVVDVHTKIEPFTENTNPNKKL